CMRFGLRYGNAREWVRVADALEELPECAQAFGEGRLSWDQVRPLTEFATPETDHLYAEATPGVSAARVEAEARRARRVTRNQAEDEHRRRSLRWWWPSDGGLRLSGFLPSAEGGVVTAALERIVEQTAADGDGVAGGRCRPGCCGCSKSGMGPAAAGRAARTGAGWRLTTWFPGPTAARPT